MNEQANEPNERTFSSAKYNIFAIGLSLALSLSFYAMLNRDKRIWIAADSDKLTLTAIFAAANDENKQTIEREK